MQLVELSENGVCDLLSHSPSSPILQVVNLTAQSRDITRVALSDGKKFIQTLAKKDLICRQKIERLALLKVLSSSLEGKDTHKVVVLREVEVLKSLTYVVGSPAPLSQMTVTVDEEVKESDLVADIGIGVFRCKECKETLAAVRAAQPFKLVFPRLVNCSAGGSKQQVETAAGIQLVQRVDCQCGVEVGVYYLAADSEALRGKYQLQQSAIDIIAMPDCSDPPCSGQPGPPTETKIEDLVVRLQDNINKSLADFSKRVNFLENAMKQANKQVKGYHTTRE